MTDQFLGEIRMFAGNFAPRGWAFCGGQLMSIAQNTALFSLLGTNYGGNGQTTFALPNLQGRAPMHAGSGNPPGLTSRVTGETGGQETVTLTNAEMPAHTHTPNSSSSAGDSADPTNNTWGVASVTRGQKLYSQNPGTGPQMNPLALSLSGGSQPHNNMPPYLAISFIIALEGTFPARG